ncbi:MAG TPA: TonB-dependent receptor, partial [Methylophilaceae bacterium]|nr:TonB-dependent receptor [Methylophilaceae bacterium]
MNKTIVASLIGLLFSAPACADDAIQTGDVVVTATRFPESRPRTPGNISIITREDIKNSPALSIPDLLKTQAGINVSNFYGNQGIDASVDIRGFGDAAISNTLILLDGQRLNAVDGSNIQWASIPLQALERIEIIRGGGSVLYGDRASGGVINLITDKSGRPAASATATLGSYGYKGLDAYVAGGGDSNVYFNTFVHSTDANGYRENTASNTLSVTGRAGFRQDGNDTFIDYSLYRVANGVPGSIDSQTFHDHPRRARTPFDSQEKKGFRLRPGTSVAIGDKLRLDAEFAISGEQYAFDNPSFGAGSTSGRNLHTVSFTPRINWQHGLATLPSQTTAGFDYYYGRVNADASSFASQDARQISKAIYLQNMTSLTDRLDLTAGVRSQNMQQQATQDAFDNGFFVTPGASGSSDRSRS